MTKTVGKMKKVFSESGTVQARYQVLLLKITSELQAESR